MANTILTRWIKLLRKLHKPKDLKSHFRKIGIHPLKFADNLEKSQPSISKLIRLKYKMSNKRKLKLNKAVRKYLNTNNTSI